MDCIFYKIARNEIHSEIVMESESFIAIRDIKPRTSGHTLIIPKKHFVTLLDIPDEMGKELLEFSKKVASDLMDQKMGEGFNVLMNNYEIAGQVVMHAHLHVIPRKKGDGIRPLA